MKRVDAEKLEPGQKVIHRRYGVCIVKEVMISFGALFGVRVRPDNQIGRDLLRRDSGCNVPDPVMLKDRPRNLSLEETPGGKPINNEMVWGIPEEDMPRQESKNHFAQFNEKVEDDMC